MGRFFKTFLFAMIVGYMIGYAIICAVIVNNAFGASTNYASKNWGLEPIEAPKAWTITQGSSKVVVAVIDTGIEREHPDLNHDILPGWDFVEGHEVYGDDNGHGTHVSGIIRAVAPNVTLMPLRYYSINDTGKTQVKRTVQAIDYAITHGANIINYSAGGPQFDKAEYMALKRAEAKGVLVVVAAGNEDEDLDMPKNLFYPASYHLFGVMSVASTGYDNGLASGSDYGVYSVDVAAPGEQIYSTLNLGKYGYMSGTSMSTAFVTGTAALLVSECHGISIVQVKDILMKTAAPMQAVVSGRINAYAALMELKHRKTYHEVICEQ